MSAIAWLKRGLVFQSVGQRPWMQSHATHPLALPLGGDRVRVYFSSRDDRQRSHLAWVELDMRQPDRILAIAEEPALAPGPLGNFDDHGVYAGCIVRIDDELWCYYVGWNPGARGPLFYATLGLAISRDGGLRFERVSAAPILARSDLDPCGVLLAWIRREQGRWRMWYGSAFRWEEDEAGMRSFYDIKYAESDDGIAWHRTGHICVPLEGDERNVGHPMVVRDADRYRMWHSSDAGDGYRIAYAESQDGLEWRRHPHSGLAPGGGGWESQTVSHPHVFDHGGRRFMLYNGNRFGLTGFGLAEDRPG